MRFLQRKRCLAPAVERRMGRDGERTKMAFGWWAEDNSMVSFYFSPQLHQKLRISCSNRGGVVDTFFDLVTHS